MRKFSSSILYCSKGLVHPTIWARVALKQLLRQAAYPINTIHHLSFDQWLQDHSPKLIVLYFHEKKITQPDLLTLHDYVATGGSLLAIHSASASFKTNPDYHSLLGGRFIAHGSIKEYRIYTNKNHPHLKDVLPETYVIKDELYRHEVQEDIIIVQETIVDGQNEPVSWLKQLGKGRIAYFAPGHRAAVFSIPPVRRTILQLVEWCMTDG